MGLAETLFGDRVQYAQDPYDALPSADALVIVTEWLVYRNPDFERIRSLVRRPLIVDGRNLYEPDRVRGLGFEYLAVGRQTG
jgi:UDPglucose 6-dehydrogenase